MNKFLTIFLLCSYLLAIVEENQVSPDTLESQKLGLTITPDNGPAIKIDTDAFSRFNQKGAVIANAFQSNNQRFNRKMQGGAEKDSEESTHHESELQEAQNLYKRLGRYAISPEDGTYHVKATDFEAILSALENYEEALNDILEEASSKSRKSDQSHHRNESHSESRSDSKSYSTDSRSSRRKNNNARKNKRSLNGAHHAHQTNLKRARSNRGTHHGHYLIRP